MSFSSSWLNMPEEFYDTLHRYAKENSISAQHVLCQVPRVLESAYHLKVGGTILVDDAPENPLIPVWFKVPAEFWTQLDRLVAKIGKPRERLVGEGLNILIQRSTFVVYEHEGRQAQPLQIGSERATGWASATTHLIEGDFEILKGTIVLRVWYATDLSSQPNASELLAGWLRGLYRKASATAGATISCAIDVKAEAEFDNLGLIKAVLDVWDDVTNAGGRIVLIGYPAVTVSGAPTLLPPLLPDFGIAKDLSSALNWVSRPDLEVEGGDCWYDYPGVHRGRSYLPGEKALTAPPADE